MRDRGLAAVLALAAVILVASLYFGFRESVPVTFRRILGGSTQAPQPAPVPEAKPPAKTKAKPKTTIEYAAVAPATPIFEVSMRMLPFPGGADVRAGMTRAEIINRFGTPAFRATWSDVGMLNEKYFYLDRNRSTAVAMRNGEVISSHTDFAQPQESLAGGVEARE